MSARSLSLYLQFMLPHVCLTTLMLINYLIAIILLPDLHQRFRRLHEFALNAFVGIVIEFWLDTECPIPSDIMPRARRG